MAQIKGDVKYDIVPTWNIGLSAASPALGANIQKVARKPNYHEMINLLLEHLRKAQQLDVERKRSRGDVLFCLETIMARKVLFPANLTKEIPGIKELVLWVSLELDMKSIKDGEYTAGPLYLIEAYSENDTPYMNPMSGYNAFGFILKDLLGETFEKMIGSKRESKSATHKFGIDPNEYLGALKAQVSEPRRIECLYRRRATFVDHSIQKVVTYGYPIFITEMP